MIADLEKLLVEPAVAVRVDAAKGSTPREEDALMVVSENAVTGTIGGGQLEYMAIDEARRMLRDDIFEATLRLPLGPEIGQCCGGNVTLTLSRVTNVDALLEDVRDYHSQEPNVYVFGAGHVGKALAAALSLLPVKVHVVDTREMELSAVCEHVQKHLVAMPEMLVREAPKGSAFVTMTHDHAGDFLIVAEALKRKDAAYIGMIGSATKRKQFERWFLTEGGEASDFIRLTSPIGGKSKDKRPAVIAAMVAAEIMTVLAPSPTKVKA